MSEELNLPPPGCPNNGICLTVLPRLKTVEDDVRGLKVSTLKIDHLETVLSERDKTGSKVWNAVLCLLGLSIVHFAAFLIWVGGTNERLAQFKESDARQNEQIFRLEHSQKP